MKWLLPIVLALVACNSYSDSTMYWYDSFSGDLSSDASTKPVTYWYSTRNSSGVEDLAFGFRCDVVPGLPKAFFIEVTTTQEMSFDSSDVTLTLDNGLWTMNLTGATSDVYTALFDYDDRVRTMIDLGHPITVTVHTITPFSTVNESTTIVKRNFEIRHPMFKGCSGSSDQLITE